MSREEDCQYLFDKSARHVLKQGRPSIKPGTKDMCMYEGPDGCSCAARPFILKYRPTMDDSNPSCGEVLNFTALVAKFSADHFDPIALRQLPLVRELQRAHDLAAQDFMNDRGDFIELYKKNMREEAAIFGLSTSVLDEVPS